MFLVASYFVDVVNNFFSQVNTQLYSAREKNDLAQLIKVMIAYNITYRQERTPEGQYTYVLEPYASFTVFLCLNSTNYLMLKILIIVKTS